MLRGMGFKMRGERNILKIMYKHSNFPNMNINSPFYDLNKMAYCTVPSLLFLWKSITTYREKSSSAPVITECSTVGLFSFCLKQPMTLHASRIWTTLWCFTNETYQAINFSSLLRAPFCYFNTYVLPRRAFVSLIMFVSYVFVKP